MMGNFHLHGAVKIKRLLVLLTIAFSFLQTESFAAPGLTLWIHPYLPATELTIRFSPLAAYLSEKLDRPVSIRVQQSYQNHLDFVGNDQADLAFVGPATYVRVRNHYGPKPLLAKLELNGKPFFHGMIIARGDSGIQSLADLAGKKFAFGDPNSTMSHFVPRAMLAQAGISLAELGEHDFLHAHHNVALAVMGGYFDAGGVKEEVYYEFEKKGLKMLAKSPPIPEHLFLARSDLPPELISRIRFHLMALNDDPRRDKILSSLKNSVTGLVPAVDQDYDRLRELMTSIIP